LWSQDLSAVSQKKKNRDRDFCDARTPTKRARRKKSDPSPRRPASRPAKQPHGRASPPDEAAPRQAQQPFGAKRPRGRRRRPPTNKMATEKVQPLLRWPRRDRGPNERCRTSRRPPPRFRPSRRTASQPASQRSSPLGEAALRRSSPTASTATLRGEAALRAKRPRGRSGPTGCGPRRGFGSSSVAVAAAAAAETSGDTKRSIKRLRVSEELPTATTPVLPPKTAERRPANQPAKQPSGRSCPPGEAAHGRNSPTGVGQRNSPTGVGQRSRPTGGGQRSSPTGVGQRSSPTGVGQRSSPTGVGQRSSPTGDELGATESAETCGPANQTCGPSKPPRRRPVRSAKPALPIRVRLDEAPFRPLQPTETSLVLEGVDCSVAVALQRSIMEAPARGAAARRSVVRGRRQLAGRSARTWTCCPCLCRRTMKPRCGVALARRCVRSIASGNSAAAVSRRRNGPKRRSWRHN